MGRKAVSLPLRRRELQIIHIILRWYGQLFEEMHPGEKKGMHWSIIEMLEWQCGHLLNMKRKKHTLLLDAHDVYALDPGILLFALTVQRQVPVDTRILTYINLFRKQLRKLPLQDPPEKREVVGGYDLVHYGDR